MLEKVELTMSEEADYFYSASSEEQDAERRCIGHLRGDFGSGGGAFWTSWFEHSPALKTPAFRTELNEVVETLRQQGLLQSRSHMYDFCMQHPDARIPGARQADVCGVCFQTPQHRYYLRCFPHRGDYNFYLYCYARPERLAERSPNVETASSGKTAQEHLSDSAATSRNMPAQAHSSRLAATPRKKSEPER